MKIVYSLLLCVLLSACSSPSAPSISGSWQPLNGYHDTIREIPLVRTYFFQSLPIDVTLKSMLTRWSKENNLEIIYEHPSDFTLNTSVAKIQQTSLPNALLEINSIYEPYHLTVQQIDGRGVVVSYLVTGINDAPPALQTAPAINQQHNRFNDKRVNVENPVVTPGVLKATTLESAETVAQSIPVTPDPLAPFVLKENTK